MLANTPAILIRGNVGVNKKYINNQTGELVDEEELPGALVSLSRDYAKFRPREWMLSNISCLRTTEKLNNVIKSIALRNGEEWTEDLRIKVNEDGKMRGIQLGAVTDHDFLDQYAR
jgi:hypothetical protein